MLASPSSLMESELKSKNTLRDCLRPSPCSIPSQFWKAPSTRACGFSVTMVLSKLRTLTIVSVISSTRPLAPAEGTVIQSPMCSISLLVSRMPATSPLMVSWKASIRMAEAAPSPAKSVVGSLLTMMAITTMTAMKIIRIFSTPQSEYRYCSRAVRRPFSNCLKVSMNTMAVRTDIIVM